MPVVGVQIFVVAFYVLGCVDIRHMCVCVCVCAGYELVGTSNNMSCGLPQLNDFLKFSVI